MRAPRFNLAGVLPAARRTSPVKLEQRWLWGGSKRYDEDDTRVYLWTCVRDPRAVRLRTRDGRTDFIVTRNMDANRAKYAWRTTRVDVSKSPGEPIGHSYGSSCTAALRAGVDSWGKVRLIDWIDVTP